MEFAARPPSYTLPSPTNPFHSIANSQRGAYEALPSYTRPSNRGAPQGGAGGGVGSGADSHSHGRRRPQTTHGHRSRQACAEHVIPITATDPMARPTTLSWAQLRIQSSAKSSKNTPSYKPGDEVVGFVELDLPREKSIISIGISMKGYTISTNDSANPKPTFPSPGYINPGMTNKPIISFLDLKTTLWKPSMGDPRVISSSSPPSSTSTTPSPPPTSSSTSRLGHGRKKSLAAKEFKEKLLGDYSFPFLFTLPTEVDNQPLPPDLYDSSGNAKFPVQIKYELEVTIQTALFKSDAMILCPFHVVPQITPPLPSAPRELIYTCRPDVHDSDNNDVHIPPGPEQDSEGWTSPKAVKFNKSSLVMSLANPLTYTRGSPIHLHLKFSGNDAHMPDPGSMKIGLVQTVSYNAHGHSYSHHRGGAKSSTRILLATAICYTRIQDEGTGVMHGEIRVPKDVVPNFEFKGIKSEFSVVLFPPTTPSSSLTPYSVLPPSSQGALISVPVKLATLQPYARGSKIVPLSFIPPYLIANTSSTGVNERSSPPPYGQTQGQGGRSSPSGSSRSAGTGHTHVAGGSLRRLDPFEQLLATGEGTGLAGRGWARV